MPTQITTTVCSTRPSTNELRRLSALESELINIRNSLGLFVPKARTLDIEAGFGILVTPTPGQVNLFDDRQWTIAVDPSSLTVTETDPIWNAEKVNYYTSAQVDTLLLGIGGTETDPIWIADKPNYLTSAIAASTYSLIGHTHSFASLTSKPTTLAGYGITDAYPLVGNPSGFLTSFSEADPIFSASPAFGISGTNITNWNAAFGWGNHASAGYLLTSTAASTYQPLDGDLTSIAALSGTSGLARKTAANTWVLDTATYLTSFSETDPVWLADKPSYLTISSAAATYSLLGHTHTFASLTSKPTTLVGYGITDGVNTSIIYLDPTWIGRLDWSKIINIPTTLSGYGITDAQPLDSDLTAVAALTTDSFGLQLLTKTSAAAIRTYIGVGTGTGTVTSVDLSVPTGLSISGNPITSSGTLAIALTSGYVIPTTTEETNWNSAYSNRITSLTVTGASGAATLISNVLNIPTYTLSGLGGTTLAAVNAQNLSAFAATTSAQLRGVLSDELGTGAALFDGATPTSFTLTNATGLPLSTGVTGTLPILNGGTGQTTAANAINALLPSQTGNSGFFLTTNGTAASWSALTASQWTTTGSDIYYNTGGVAVGKTSVTSGLKLDVGGNATFTNSSASADLQIYGTLVSSNPYARIFLGRTGQARYTFLTHESNDAYVVNHWTGAAFTKSMVGTNAADAFLGGSSLTSNGSNAVLTVKAGGQVGVNQTSPAVSSVLDLVSTTKGFLPPRGTTTNKNAISSPAEGLVFYDTTLHKLCVYTGSAWETITSV